MWKPSQTGNQSQNPNTPNREPMRPTPPASPAYEPPRAAAPAQTVMGSADQATIGKSLVVKGEVTGSESLFIDGKVEGSITLPGNRVTVGRNGNVSANISAREIVVLGKVRGNATASDRVDIRSEGSLIGDVTAQRISIEDGAYFKGGIDIKKSASEKPAASAGASSSTSSSTTTASATA